MVNFGAYLKRPVGSWVKAALSDICTTFSYEINATVWIHFYDKGYGIIWLIFIGLLTFFYSKTTKCLNLRLYFRLKTYFSYL